MTNLKKIVLCLGLVSLTSLPLSACTSTWQGMKEDWHSVTDGNSTSVSETSAVEVDSSAGEPAVVKTTTVTTYN
ncbi:MAG TPA: hypothetical protein VEF76_00265 [Patescibacteria group bacterium]|nr:hypothetical protein [Patescibacteria group bacterium]